MFETFTTMQTVQVIMSSIENHSIHKGEGGNSAALAYYSVIRK